MKPNVIKAFIHAWGLFWVIVLSFYILEVNKASVVVLCTIPFNYWISNMIFRSIFEKPKDK